MYSHLLLPIDGSELSERAADAGIALASRLGAKVMALQVVAPFPATTYLTEVVMTTEKAYDEQAAAHAEQCLQRVSERAREAGVVCETHYTFDARPYKVIIEMARSHDCDLIVMGSHGRRGLDRLLLGSQTHRVLIGCDIPVLVCH